MTILMLLSNIYTSFAQGSININADKNNIILDEEIAINISISNTEISSMTLEIYWDRTKLEYLKGPDNSNNLNDRIVYTWVNESGINTNNISIDSFTFKSIDIGTTNVVVAGEFYNSNGDIVKIDNNSIELEIQNEIQENIEYYTNQESVVDDNAYLKILRLNHEGISPEFDKNTFDYYFIADKNLNSLEVTAVAEHQDARVSIIGNNNLQFGENTITINVNSKDGSNSLVYTIHVTKTDDLEAVNANLENLAVKQGILVPEFDNNITKYNVEVANNVNNLDILAVPEDMNATAKIVGNDKLQIGNNKIEITVVAKNGTTFKKYEINAYRRSEAEQQQTEEKNKAQAEQLAALLEENNIDNNSQGEEITTNNRSNIGPIITFIALIILLLIFIMIRKYKKK